MARNIGGTYSLPSGSLVTDGVDDILASQHNTPLQDIAADLNIARPIVAGGTGASTAAGALVNFGLTATAAEINAAANFGLIAQGSLSGSELIVEIPSDFEGIEFSYWNYLPSVSGQGLSLAIGSGTIGAPVWGSNHYDQVQTVITTTYAPSSNGPTASIPASLLQLTGQPPGSGRFGAEGFNVSGSVAGWTIRRGVVTGPARASSTGVFSEETTVVHTLIRLFVSSGTMSGTYRLTGYRKP